ncbi:MAG: restriction endonuclease [bacterium]|nr:restriction endonuclease [bacterium]
MTETEFERLLAALCERLTAEARQTPFTTSKQFENRVREVVQELINDPSQPIDFDPHPQAFPDIAIGAFGIEVKFTTADTWRSVANSVLERNRIDAVKKIYLVFGKMGGTPEVKAGDYEKCVMHVRTSHVPRFEVEVFPQPQESLFEKMKVTYDEFRLSPMEAKMKFIRHYARGRLKEGERLWWLEDNPESDFSLPIQARLYTSLPIPEKNALRAEAILLCPHVVKSGRDRKKYEDVAMFLLTYHGVLVHQARDLFSAGSVANPQNDDQGGIYIERSLKLLQNEMLEAALRMDDALFIEYWGESVTPEDRIARWLDKADALAHDWTPSKSLFLEYQEKRRRLD